MTRAIYKYPLQHGRQTIEVPEGARSVAFQMQGDTPTVWMLVDIDQTRKSSRTFSIFGTGAPIHGYDRYVGTTQDGPFVWHLFELDD